MVGIFEVDILDAVDISRQSTFGQPKMVGSIFELVGILDAVDISRRLTFGRRNDDAEALLMHCQ